MRPARPFVYALAALGVALTAAVPSHADPVEPPAPGPAVPGPGNAIQAAQPVEPVDSTAAAAAADACDKFNTIMDYAASGYSDFAENLAGAKGDYSNGLVTATNSGGRSALREAASAANDVANTPGLDPEIATPMHKWSGDAHKLWILMGLRVGVDGVNGKATDLNNDADNVKMGCAHAGIGR